MAIGVTRPRSHGGRGAAFAAEYSLRPTPLPVQDWAAVRGALAWQGRCDLAGGFPGFALQGGFLARGRVRISDRYFLVDEGHAHGFGLLLSSMTGVFAVDLPDRGDALVRIQYRDGDLVRAFTVHFRGPLAALWPSRRAHQMVRALQTAGATPVLTDEALPEPDLRVAWSAAGHYQYEPAKWYGRVLAPVALGEVLRPSEVWLTPESIIWGCDRGRGINRVPLSLVREIIPAHVENRAGTPALYLGVDDDAGGRHEIAFHFHRASARFDPEQQQTALLTALRRQGIPLGSAPGRRQPWRLDPPVEPLPLLPLAPRTTAPAIDRPPVVPEPESAPPVLSTEYVEAVAAPAAVTDLAASPMTLVVTEPMEEAPIAPETSIECANLTRFRQLEARALANLAAVLRAIDDRLAGQSVPVPALEIFSPSEQTQAIHELAEAAMAGQVTWEAVYQRRSRLAAVLEAIPRLRTLLEFHASGQLDAETLERSRQEIAAEVSSLIPPAEPVAAAD